MMRSPLVRVLSTLWKMLNPKRKARFIAMVAAVFVSGLLDMSGMLIIFGFIGGLSERSDGGRGGRLGKVFDLLDIGPFSQEQWVLQIGAFVISVLLFKNVFSTLVQFYLNKFLMKLNQAVSEELFNGYLRTSFEKVNAKGEHAAAGDISKIFEVFSSCFACVAQLLSDGVLLSTVVLVLFIINPSLTLAGAFLFGGVGASIYWSMQKGLVAMGREDRVARQEAQLHLSDGIHGLLETRLRDARKHMVTSYARGLARTALIRRRKLALERLPRSANEILLVSMVVGSVFYLLRSGESIESALPTLTLFGFAGLRMTGAMTRVNKQFQKLKGKAEQFEEYYELVRQIAPAVFGEKVRLGDTDYLRDEEVVAVREGRMLDRLVLRNVSFRYPEAERPALRNVSLEVPIGSFVGICGPSGGGKSTLALLMMGLVRPTEGSIHCDDWNIFAHIRAWHSRIGYVGQNMYISARSIRENVAFGLPRAEIDNRRVWEALRLASGEEFVRSLPMGLNHVLKGGGKNLSGGQRQRIVIARALYRDPDILVFDEATAALDNVTESQINGAIRALSGEKTVICIAHRLSTIQRADQIYVLADGEVRARGTYEELLQISPDFKRLTRPDQTGDVSDGHFDEK